MSHNLIFSAIARLLVLIVVCISFSTSVIAQNSQTLSSLDEEEEIDEIEEASGLLDNEDDEELEIQLTEKGKQSHQQDWLSFLIAAGRLSYRHEWAYHTAEPERIVINRSSLRLQWEKLLLPGHFLLFDWKMAYNAAYDRLEYPREIEQRYRFQEQTREFYLQSSFENISYKLGKQIIVWGEADGAEVTDVISPRDLSEFLFIPLEDARIGQVMLTTEYYQGSEQWMLILNPDPKVNRFARPGHEYALPSMTDQPGIMVKEENKPVGSLVNMEIGIRWKKTIEQSDLSLMAADLIADTPVYRFEHINDQGLPVLQPEYFRFQMLGAAANLTEGNFLWKGELAGKFRRVFQRSDFLKKNALIERNVIDTALGLEYDANGAYLIIIEISNQHLLNWTRKINSFRRDEGNLYASISKNFLHETLKPQYTLLHQIQDQETVHQFETVYEINDQWSSTFKGTYFDSHQKNSSLGFFQNRHRISIDIEAHF